MEVRKTAIIIVDFFAGLIVSIAGSTMLQSPLNLVWMIFNAWLWIVSPTTILWAKKREDEKNSTSSKMW